MARTFNYVPDNFASFSTSIDIPNVSTNDIRDAINEYYEDREVDVEISYSYLY